MTFDWTSLLYSKSWTRFSWFLNLFIISCVVYFSVNSAGVTWLEFRLSPKASITPRETEIKKQIQAQKQPLREYQVISQRNLFGGHIKPQPQKNEPEPKNELDIEKIPLAQSLKVKLLGTIVASDSIGNRAIILDTGKNNQAIYRKGDQFKNVTIKKILRNKVVVNNGKRDEILLMDMDKEASDYIKEQPTREAQSQNTNTINLSRNFVRKSTQNMVDIMKKVRIVPYQDKNDNRGFQLLHLKKDSFFRKLGLKNRDVLLGVNGESLRSPKKILEFYNNLQNMDNISLKIKRNNSVKNLEYSIY